MRPIAQINHKMGGLVGIVGFSIRNWRMTLGIMLFAVIGGFMALSRLALDAEPDIPVPFITVQVVLPGVSPEDAERLLIRPLETELKSIDGLKQMDGTARTNVGIMVLEFEASYNLDMALASVLEKVDRARSEFPPEAHEPIVEEISIAALPIVVVNLWGDLPERELQQRAKDIQIRLEGLPSILSANITGERSNVLEGILDPSKLESLGVSYDEIALAVSRNNSLVPAGAVETSSGKFNVKLPGLITGPDDLSKLVIRRGDNGSIITMADIANIRESYTDVSNFARFNQRPSISIEVAKRQGENIIDSVAQVEAVVREITAQPGWPETLNISYSQSRAKQISDMTKELSASIVNAVILVFIVSIIALGWRSAIFVGWAIPSSFLIAFFLFYIQGRSINMMILFGLILSVGVLVDSAIVIVEYADRKMEEGLARREAFQMAGERMFWPIISSTATTLAAFLPLLFWDSITGKFMAYFPLTMIYVLTASMLMAIIFLPTMGALIGFSPKKVTHSNAALLAGPDGDPLKTIGFTGMYVRLINRLLRFPILVMLGIGLLGFIIITAFKASVAGPPPKPIEFFTQTPSEQIFVLGRTRGNTTPEQSLNIAKEMERRLADIEGIKSIYTVAGPAAAGSGGGGEGLTGPANVPTDTTIRIYTELFPFNERARNVEDIATELAQAMQGLAGVVVEITTIDQGPPVSKDVGLQISSENRADLYAATKKMTKKLGSMEGVYELENSLPLPGIDWELEVNRAEAGRLGLDIGTIGSAIQFLTEGAIIGTYRPLNVDEEVDIRIRYPQDMRGLAQLETLRIQTPAGPLPLSAVAENVPKPRNDIIARRDLSPFFIVQANTQKGYATNIQVNEVQDWIKSEANFPESVKIKFLGQAEENAEAAQFAITAGLAILFMMSVILLLQFNSFYHVFLTLFSVILSIFGVILGLTFYPYVSAILVLTGVIALAGIVVNNNIVLIDTYQRLKALGISSQEAALKTAAQRLRPVVLTTLTTIIGLTPLMLGWQADIFTGEFSTRGSNTSDIWAPISYTVSCGLGFATILTLIVTPVLLAMPEVLAERTKPLRAKLRSKAAPNRA